MNRCRNCNIEILDDTDRCPFCKSVLQKDGDGVDAYPDARVRTKRMRLFSNILLFLVIVAISVISYINYETYNEFAWSLIVDGAIIVSYIEFKIIIVSFQEYVSKYFKSMILINLFLILIDYVLGYEGWSVDFALPSSIIISCIVVVVMMIIDRKNWQSYLMYQLFLVLCGVMALMLMIFNINKQPILCQVAFGISTLLFIGTVIIGDRQAKSELARRFHIK